MNQLLEKLKRARQINVTAGGFGFTIRRPTPMEALEWLGEIDADTTRAWFAEHFSLKSSTWREAAWYAVRRFVVDWQLNEIDIIPGGTDVRVEYDNDLMCEWLKDQPSVFNELAVGIYESWLTYLTQRESDEKKSQTGEIASQ